MTDKLGELEKKIERISAKYEAIVEVLGLMLPRAEEMYPYYARLLREAEDKLKALFAEYDKLKEHS